jgi:hypothetical protein
MLHLLDDICFLFVAFVGLFVLDLCLVEYEFFFLLCINANMYFWKCLNFLYVPNIVKYFPELAFYGKYTIFFEIIYI